MQTVQETVLKMAHAHGVVVQKTPVDMLAETITALAGDRVETDDTERLILALRRAHVLNGESAMLLLGKHLNERRHV
ncbi:hypothetical protein ACJU26_05800 [Acidithiobacillus sp. M4-SHS-6]|uniref:hypothetical protein n=1 Tax=Acidithiobacillus sp. M4-SHS-6 TaxID=3383024 RepID=UPI0039BE7D1E